MSLNSVNTNVSAQVALQSLNATNSSLQATQKRISTGYRVADATDDGAAFAVAQKVRADVGSLQTVNQQLGSAKGLVGTAVTSLTNISDSVTQAKSLLVDIANTSISADQRAQYVTSYKNLVTQVANSVDGAVYNGQSLLGSASGSTATSLTVINSSTGTSSTLSAEDSSSLANTLASLIGATFTRSAAGVDTFTAGTDTASQTAASNALSTTTGTTSFAVLQTTVLNHLNQAGADSNYLDSQVTFNSNKIDSLNSGLGSLVDRYNQERSKESGLFVLIAALDDYFELLGCYRDQLPKLEVDPNPAWMGFYASRPELKSRHTRTVRRLLHAENESARSGVERGELDEAWELVTLSNHHDFITGTSPDRVVDKEQIPWLHNAEALLGPIAEQVYASHAPPRWRRRRHQVHVESKLLEMTFSEERGGCLTRLRNQQGQDLLSPGGLGLDLIAYHDTGGLWRLGHEFAGGKFRERERASERPGRVRVFHEYDALRIEIVTYLDCGQFRRTLWVRDAAASLRLRTEGMPATRTTLTCSFQTAQKLKTLRMDAAGGHIDRPLQKLYAPTFWPALSTVETPGLSLSLDSPTAISAGTEGGIEWIVARHAPKERAFWVLPVMAHPIGGTVQAAQTHDTVIHLGPAPREEHGWIHCNDAGVHIGMVKPAANRKGIIVRLHADVLPTCPVRLTLDGHALQGASLCDARETDLQTLSVADGTAHVTLSERIATVRLLHRRAA